MGAGGAANLWGGALSVLGQQKAQKQSNKGYKLAINQYGTPPMFQGSNWWDAMTGPNSELGNTAKALLAGNGLNELEPALRSNAINTQNQQRSFASALGKSGLTGSGFGLGNNYAIQNQGAVNKSNILAQLPALQRENLSTLFPYFSRYLGNQEFRTKGLGDLYTDRGNMQAASVANQYQTAANAFGGGGAGKGNQTQWQGPKGQTAPAGGKGGAGGK